jgi:hypothetical protein
VLDELDGQDLFNTMVLQRTVPHFLVVEGEEDFDLLLVHLDASAVEMLVGYGKRAVLDAAEIAVLSGFDRASFLVDADFDRLLGNDAYPSNVFATDFYDLAYDACVADPWIPSRIAIAVAGGQPALAAVTGGYTQIVEIAIEAAAYVGSMRLASEVGALNLKTAKFPMGVVVDLVLGRVVESAVHDLLDKRTPIPNRVAFETAVVAAHAATTRERRVNGHELLRAIGHASRHFVGTASGDAEQLFLAACGCAAIHGIPAIRAIDERRRERASALLH